MASPIKLDRLARAQIKAAFVLSPPPLNAWHLRMCHWQSFDRARRDQLNRCSDEARASASSELADADAVAGFATRLPSDRSGPSSTDLDSESGPSLWKPHKPQGSCGRSGDR
jgi:hypothetical protein